MENISVTLPDGSIKQLPKGSTGLDLALSIGPGLAKDAVAIEMNNIQKDADFIEIVENLELKNLNLCSAKVSRNIFYLHDLLLDGYEQLKKNGVLNAYH